MTSMTQPPDVRRSMGVPLHHQVSIVMRDGIVNGRYQPGEALPSEGELCQMYSVSRITVRRAMQSLAEEGLIERRQGRGTFVRAFETATQIAVPLDQIKGRSAEIGARTRGQLIDYAFVQPPNDVRQALKLKAGDLTLRIVRVRWLAALPILHTALFLPEDVGQRISREALEKTPFLRLMKRAAGQTYHHGAMVIGAALADPLLAQRLKVAVGSPLLEIKRTGFNESGRPIEHQTGHASPDRHKVRLTFGANDPEVESML